MLRHVARKASHDFSEALYKKYKEVFEEYTSGNSGMPALKSKSEESLLRELDLRWKNHDIMVRWMSAFLQLFGQILHRSTLVCEFEGRRDDVLSGGSVQDVSRSDERRDVDVD